MDYKHITRIKASLDLIDRNHARDDLKDKVEEAERILRDLLSEEGNEVKLKIREITK